MLKSSYVQQAGRMRPVEGFRCNKSILHTTCPYFDNLEFDLFDAGGPQCHFITSVTIAVTVGFERFQYISLS